jgi:branched-chain amino acid transport system substrate-binding protein
MKLANVVLGVCVGLAWLSGARAADPIVIGEVSSMSGPLAVGGVPGRQGAILALEQINQKGGVLGRPLQFIVRDDKTQPEEAGKAFREIAAQGALLTLGTTGSATTAAMNSLARELKVPFFTMMGYSRFLTEEAGHRYFFRLITNDRVFGHTVADAVAKQPQTKYCTVANDFAFGRDLTNVFMTRLKAAKPGVEVLPGCEFWVPLGATDFTPNLTAMLARRPQAVLFGGLVGASSTAFVKQAKAFGLFTTALGVHPSLGMQVNNLGLSGKDDVPDGIFTGTDYVYPPVPTPASRAFFDAYRKRWNQLPTEQSSNAYATLRFIAKAIEKAGKLDREAFVDAAEGLSIDHPILGEITVRAFDHQSTAGWWMGYLAWDETNKRVGVRDARYLKGDAYLPTKEELEKIRSRK